MHVSPSQDASLCISRAQVALQFVMAQGCMPLPGVKNAAQAREIL